MARHAALQVLAPHADVLTAVLLDTVMVTVGPWKGTASYCDMVVADAANDNAAWTPPQRPEAAAGIRDYVAFWEGVTVEVRSLGRCAANRLRSADGSIVSTVPQMVATTAAGTVPTVAVAIASANMPDAPSALSAAVPAS